MPRGELGADVRAGFSRRAVRQEWNHGRHGATRNRYPVGRGTVPPVTGTLALAYPFTGRWQVRNSPANRVPSHGTSLFATTHAIDFVPVDPRMRSAPFTLRALVGTEPPELFVGFGLPILAPVAGTVVAAHDGEPDHDASRGLASVGYALTQRRRAMQGWAALAGNHVLIEVGVGVVVAVCHLRRGSLTVVSGQHVQSGSPLGQCGNSGNSTEPHVHLQAMTDRDPDRAAGLPISFPDGVPRNGTVVTI